MSAVGSGFAWSDLKLGSPRSLVAFTMVSSTFHAFWGTGYETPHACHNRSTSSVPPPPATVRALQESNHISSVDIFRKLLACVYPGHLVYVAGETLGGAG